MAIVGGHLEAQLSTSTLSALSSASASLSEHVDLGIVDEIVERAPRTATQFPFVYRAYTEVLDEHGISSLQDNDYYHFLLKLGTIRAPSWGQKWDLFKTSLAVSSRPSPRRPRYSSLSATRARVPFLASASSDLDEGFEPEPDTYDGDESVVSFQRRSPRTAICSQVDGGDKSRSLVGYTPLQSIDFEDISINPPARTSTPVFAQANNAGGRGRVALPSPPPYSVSDVSEALPTATLTDEPSTPRPLPLDLDSDRWDPATEREMERRADGFYLTGLMGRCWDVWSQSYHWVKSTTDQIDRVRSGLLQRRAMDKWRLAYKRRLDLPSTADRHRNLHLQSRALSQWIKRFREHSLQRAEEAWRGRKTREAWTRWRLETIQRQTTRWQRAVRSKERAFTNARNTRLLIASFETWFEVYREKVDGDTADRFHQEHTLYQAFGFWLKRASLSRTLADARQAKDESLLGDAFDEWRRRAQISSAEMTVVEARETRIAHQVLQQWRHCQDVCHKARTFDETRLKSIAFSQWIIRHRRIKAMKRTAVARHASSLLWHSLHIWTTLERGSLFTRVKDVRRLNKAFLHWQTRTKRLFENESLATSLADRFQQAFLHRHFSSWRSRLGDYQQDHLRAVLIHEANEMKLVSAAFGTWRAASNRVKRNVATADKARAFFVSREALKVWRVKLRVRNQDKMVERRRLEDLGLYFEAWKFRLEQSRKDALAIERFHDTKDVRMLGGALSKWTARVIQVKTREHEVIKARKRQLKREALSRWVKAAQRVKSAQELMQSFIQVRTEEQNRRLLFFWRDEAKRLQYLREEGDRSLLERDDRLLVDAFEKWVDKTKERSLKAIEEQVELRREDAVMFQVWDKWKARSTRLPEISFANKRILKEAWGRWRRAVSIKSMEKSISEPMAQRLLEDVFAVWRRAARQKVALHATRVRRTRPGHSTPFLNPPSRPTSGPIRHSTPRLPSLSKPPNPTRRLSDRRVSLPLPSDSVVGEPAYSRLYSELYSRRRGKSEEPESGSGQSELVRQLRGVLP